MLSRRRFLASSSLALAAPAVLARAAFAQDLAPPIEDPGPLRIETAPGSPGNSTAWPTR